MKVIVWFALVCLLSYAAASSGTASPTLQLSATIRDQAPAYMTHTRYPAYWWTYPNPGGWTDYPTYGHSGTANGTFGFSVSDFELPMWMYGSIRNPNSSTGYQINGEYGLVGLLCNSSTYKNCGHLGSDGTPVYQYTGRSPWGTVQSPDTFFTWFHDTNVTQAIQYTFVFNLVPNTARTYTYTNNSFFPLDGLGWADQGWDGSAYHNFGFCCQVHSLFTYSGGETFSFEGDDDMWVFIGGYLVIDLGGAHTALTATVSLDNLQTPNGFLTIGNYYTFDMFYCERHTTSSSLQITTTIELNCPSGLIDQCGVCGGNGQSCCTTQDIENCNDNNVCTTDLCAVTVPGGCQHVNTSSSCNLNVACSIDSCDPTNGCTHTPKLCDDNNMCTLNQCNNATGCVYPPITCPEGNQCYSSGCSAATGCTMTPIPCPANTKCVTYSCANATGCSPTNTNCDNGNKCQTFSCDPDNGCQYQNISCNDFNACTNDTCSPTVGCVHTPIVCSDSICATGVCSNATGGCVYTNLTCASSSDCSLGACPNTSLCSYAQKNCDTNGCTYIEKNCTTGNPCAIGFCNSTTGACGSNAVNPTGSCLPCGPNACTWTDPCNPLTCGPNGQCVPAPFNCTAPNACSISSCMPVGGQAHCNVTAKSCAGAVAADECTPIVCDNTLGCINSTKTACEDYNPCTVDECAGPNNCTHTVPADICDDGDGCTVDTCNSAFSNLTDACQHTNKTCIPPNQCLVAAGCNSVTGNCTFVPRVCPTPDDWCSLSLCDNNAGCINVPKQCNVTDINCFYGVCNNVSKSCTQAERSGWANLQTNGGTCLFVYDKGAVAGIAAGTVAGIVIGAVAVAGLVGFGGKKGYEWLSARNNPIGGAANNPLYEGSSGSGVNALYGN